MKILAFETATSACSAALMVGDEILDEYVIAPQRHAELILPMIDTLLSRAGLRLDGLNAIAFGCGPGSFMGVRIAAGVAQGLAFGADLPVIPVSTLQALAQTAYQQTGCPDIIAAWDARMQGIYWGIYHLDQKKIMQAVSPEALNSPTEVQIPAGHNWLLAGNAWESYSQELSPIVPLGAKILNIYPQSRAILTIAAVLLDAGQVKTAMEIEPVYLRNEVAHKKK